MCHLFFFFLKVLVEYIDGEKYVFNTEEKSFLFQIKVNSNKKTESPSRMPLHGSSPPPERSWRMFLNIDATYRKCFAYLCSFAYSNIFFPTCDFFIFKLNRCICISFKKSGTLSSMKMPFKTMGLFGGCSRTGLLLSIFFF